MHLQLRWVMYLGRQLGGRSAGRAAEVGRCLACNNVQYCSCTALWNRSRGGDFGLGMAVSSAQGVDE